MKEGFLLAAAALALWTLAPISGLEAEAPTMVDLASRLYKNATPDSFDSSCRGPDSKLEVTGDRHKCVTPQSTRIVEFAGHKPTNVTVTEKGIRKGVMGQVKRRFGEPDAAKTLGAMKMHFWFTDSVRVGVAFQSSKVSRSTMVRFESPN